MSSIRHISAAFAVAVVLVLSLMGTSRAFSLFGSNDETTVTAENAVVSIPVAAVSDGTAHFYTYQHEGRDIRFFVIKSSDGVIRAAFDACDVCWQAGKGYTQDGEFMICDNCGRRFHGSRINEVEGGCNPAPLLRTLDGDTLRIAVTDLLAGARFFVGGRS